MKYRAYMHREPKRLPQEEGFRRKKVLAGKYMFCVLCHLSPQTFVFCGKIAPTNGVIC